MWRLGLRRSVRGFRVFRLLLAGCLVVGLGLLVVRVSGRLVFVGFRAGEPVVFLLARSPWGVAGSLFLRAYLYATRFSALALEYQRLKSRLKELF